MVALITGGGRGIGRAIALRLAKLGWGVAIAARSAEELAETAKAAGGRTLPITADVSDPEQVRTMVERTLSELGPISLLVNNAGIAGPMSPLWETDPKDWWRCMEVNVRGPMLCCREVIPGMMRRGGGRIVNLSSGAGAFAVPNMGAYPVTKTAITRFSEQLALELAPHGIQVFPIRPGVVRTRMVESVRHKIPVVQKYLDEGRDMPPEATADLVEYIASGKADALSGCLLSVGENWDDMARRAEEIRREKMYVLSVREIAGQAGVSPMTMDEINGLSEGEFGARLGWIFEHSRWVAERTWSKRPFTSLDHLHAAMMETVERASRPEQMALLRAHPELGAPARVGAPAAAPLSAASAAEQKGAGLDRLTITDHEHLMRLIRAYHKKFGFPFIYAVKGAGPQDILKALEQRLEAPEEGEFQEALRQVYRIARFRLEEAIRG